MSVKTALLTTCLMNLISTGSIMEGEQHSLPSVILGHGEDNAQSVSMNSTRSDLVGPRIQDMHLGYSAKQAGSSNAQLTHSHKSAIGKNENERLASFVPFNPCKRPK